MPFQSEKQRRYLWANEPEIARDWTDTYGSGIAKALGGRVPFQEGSFGNWLGDATGYTQHNINNQLLRNAMASNQINEEQYKRMSGYDVAQNMPNFMQNKTLPVGLASLGYQGAKTVAGWINPDDPNAQYGDVGRLGSIGLNMQGAQGLSSNDLALYSNIMNPRSAFQDDANYIPRQTMASNWNQLDDLEAQNLDIPRRQQLSRLADMEQYPTVEEEDDDSKPWEFLKTVGRAFNPFSKLPFKLNPSALMPSGGIANFANTMRGGLTQRGYEQARKQRRQRSRVANMLARKAAEEGTGAFSQHAQKKLNQLTMGSRPGHYDPPGGNGVQGTDTPASGAGGWGPGAR
jgi:hypothetical protein